MATVKALSIDESSRTVVFAGDQVSTTLSGIEMHNVAVGYILCDPQSPVQVSSKFQARVVIFNVTVPITKGFPVRLCKHKHKTVTILFYFIFRLFYIISHLSNQLS